MSWGILLVLVSIRYISHTERSKLVHMVSVLIFYFIKDYVPVASANLQKWYLTVPPGLRLLVIPLISLRLYPSLLYSSDGCPSGEIYSLLRFASGDDKLSVSYSPLDPGNRCVAQQWPKRRSYPLLVPPALQKSSIRALQYSQW